MTPLIKAQSLSRVFSHTGHHQALHGFSAELHTGQLVGLSGSSGTGKSTLLHILGALDIGYEGSAQLNAVELKSMSEQHRAELRRNKVSLAFQTPHLFPHLTVHENIDLSARIAGTHEHQTFNSEVLIERFGLKRLLGSTPAMLSGGEKRRVGIVQALSRPACVYLLDEPSVHLDALIRDELFRVLRELKAHDKLVVFSSHSQEDLACADVVYDLKVAAS